MSDTLVQDSPRALRIALLSVKVLLAAVFFAAGGLKIYGLPRLVAEFQQMGFGDWFRYVTGLLEIGGAIAILIPRLAAVGAALLVCIMAGAIAVHVLLIGGSAWPAVALLVLSSTVLVAHRREFQSVFSRQDADGRYAASARSSRASTAPGRQN